jgi:hypothetical protein
MPGSGPRRHDTRQRLIAPTACRKTSLPASHHYCPGASKAARDAGDDAKIAPSTASAATNFLPRSAIRRRLPRPAHPLPKPPPHQISIDARLLTQPPRVPSWEAFGSRPSVRLERSRSAGIRNPAPIPTLAGMVLTPASGRDPVDGLSSCSRQKMVVASRAIAAFNMKVADDRNVARTALARPVAGHRASLRAIAGCSREFPVTRN